MFLSTRAHTSTTSVTFFERSWEMPHVDSNWDLPAEWWLYKLLECIDVPSIPVWMLAMLVWWILCHSELCVVSWPSENWAFPDEIFRNKQLFALGAQEIRVSCGYMDRWQFLILMLQQIVKMTHACLRSYHIDVRHILHVYVISPDQIPLHISLLKVSSRFSLFFNITSYRDPSLIERMWPQKNILRLGGIYSSYDKS